MPDDGVRHLQGDSRERSVDMNEVQMANGNVLPMTMSKFHSETTTPQARSFAPSQQTSFRDLRAAIANDPHRMRNSAATAVMTPPEEIQKIQEEIDQEEQIDFALSNGPYQVRSGGEAGLGVQSQEDANSIEGAIFNFGFNQLHGGALPSRSHSLKQPKSNLDKGAFSSRLLNVVSPMQVAFAAQGPHKTGTSTYKQENTDSEFWNLTADDDSQIDPVLVMRNLSNTNLFSGSTSIIQIQEADNKTSSQRPSVAGTMKQSVESQSPQPQLPAADASPALRQEAGLLLEKQNSSGNTNDEQTIEVQLL